MAPRSSSRPRSAGRSSARPDRKSTIPHRPAVAFAVVVALSLFGAVGTAGTSSSSTPLSDAGLLVNASLRGESGRLFARFISADPRAQGTALFTRLFGGDALTRPGVYPVERTGHDRPFAFIALHPFTEKQDGQLGSYRIGYWPGERGVVQSWEYENPVGFIEVTLENQDLPVSEHFRLRDFLTHDQANVWPKYLVLREALVDKLELVISELERSGIQVRHMTVMSGFRTPQYNATGGITAGRDELSRHMYGDASDVFIDNDGDGRMDDLNGDGRIDYRDAQIIVAAVERVEASFKSLVGGAGVYKATAEHGPFVHIDARGDRQRWGLVQ